MRVTTLLSEPFTANVHVVEAGEDALVVDSGSGRDFDALAAQLARALGSVRRVKAIHLTHCHCDHAGGAARLRALTGARVTIHAADARPVEAGDAVGTLGAFVGLRQEACPCAAVAEGDAIEVGGRRFEVLSVPGHTPGSTALFEPESRSLFAGDLVFPAGSFGRVDFPGGDAAALVRSLERVAALDVENLYAGHMEPVEGKARNDVRWSLENARTMLD